MQKDLHTSEFDEGTLTKLDIFESYTKEWLPTFVMNQFESKLLIFDLFAGPGYSITGQEGSPIRILKQVESQIGNIFQTNKTVYLLFNELDKEKVKKLKDACNNYRDSHADLKRAVELKRVIIKVTSLDVEYLFPKIKDSFLGKFPILLFLDQNGIKFLGDEYFLPLANARKVDFLFYSSSSFFVRFGKQDAFKNVLDIDVDKVKELPYTDIHRTIIQRLREKLPKTSQTKLYPFTIKKNTNIYGIIFGASHPRAFDKFLSTAWKENGINGEANFDIDDDRNKGQVDLFGHIELTKLMKFNKDLRAAILNHEVENNKEAYDFALAHGHLPKHASDEIKKMKKEGLLTYDKKSPLVNYDQVYKKRIKFNIFYAYHKNRMDRKNMESRNGMHEKICRMRTLLCRNDGSQIESDG